MGWYGDRVLPRLVELSLGSRDVRALRDRACAGLEGSVLELGFGSGLNVPHYPPTVAEVAAVEPSDQAWRMARSRIERSPVTVDRVGLDGERLDAASESYDHVLVTFSLCTIPDHVLALREAHRVLRPGGRIHFVEHGLSDEPRVQRWQRRLEPLQRRVAGGCHLTRDPVEALGQAGFSDVEVATSYLPGPAVLKPMGFCYLGTAGKE